MKRAALHHPLEGPTPRPSDDPIGREGHCQNLKALLNSLSSSLHTMPLVASRARGKHNPFRQLASPEVRRAIHAARAPV